MLTFDAVREIGLSLAHVVDGTAYGAPALKLLIPRMSAAGSPDAGPRVHVVPGRLRQDMNTFVESSTFVNDLCLSWLEGRSFFAYASSRP